MPGQADFSGGAHDVAGGVDAAERAELRVVETLRAERDAIDPGPGVLAEACVLDSARVRLKRHFDVARHRQQRCRAVKHAPD
jgi:hypothetical protein